MLANWDKRLKRWNLQMMLAVKSKEIAELREDCQRRDTALDDITAAARATRTASDEVTEFWSQNIVTDGSFPIRGLLSLSWTGHLGLLEAENWSSWGSLQTKRQCNIWPKTGHPCSGKQGSPFSSEPQLFPSLKSFCTILYLGCSLGIWWLKIFLKHLCNI